MGHGMLWGRPGRGRSAGVRPSPNAAPESLSPLGSLKQSFASTAPPALQRPARPGQTPATGGDLDVPAAHAASASLPAARCPTVTLGYTESAPIVVQEFDHEPEVSVFGPRPDRGRGPEGLRDTYGEGQVDARERGTTSV